MAALDVGSVMVQYLIGVSKWLSAGYGYVSWVDMFHFYEERWSERDECTIVTATYLISL
jgi:hypothetical protein